MNYWLMKSEPSTFSIDDLIKRPKQREPWEGVRNYQARNYIKEMRIKDKAFFYHSSCKEPGIVGIVEIIKDPYPDPTQFNPESKYYDPRSTIEKPRWFLTDVQFLEKFDPLLQLTIIKQTPALQNLVLVKPGNRLSVMPVSAAEWKATLSLF